MKTAGPPGATRKSGAKRTWQKTALLLRTMYLPSSKVKWRTVTNALPEKNGI